MKLVKPMVVSFSFRTLLVRGRQELSVTSLVGFSLGDGVRRLVSDVALWPAIGEATAGVIDEGLPKPRGEVLVYGSCHPSGGRPVTTSYVRVRIAPPEPASNARQIVDKKLALIGDRYWLGSASRGPTKDPVPRTDRSTPPEPFSEMPLGWERAFGGASFPRNPSGRGTERVAEPDGVERVPLPNVELPANLVTDSAQRPDPAGLGPLDVSWPQRRSKAGTYDARWLEEDFPGYARDTDPAFFSTALPDQWIEGFFRGDEEYLLENMHPAHPVVRGRLPGVAARVVLRRTGATEVEDVKTRLDTVIFLPDKLIGIAVFRGVTPVTEDDAADVSHVLAACEDLDAPRSLAHYAAALDGRLDKDQSGFLALREDDLVPSFATGSGMAEVLRDALAPDGAPDALKTMTERAMARVRQELVDAGVEDPDAVLARADPSPPGLEVLAKLPDFGDPASVAAFEKALEEVDAYAEKLLGQAHLEAEKQIAEARRDGASLPENALDAESVTGAGPPAPQAPQHLAMFQEAGIEPDPGLVEKLHSVDALALEAYREIAHYAPPPPPLDGEARERARSLVAARRARGEGFAALDCTRYDLSGLDLQRSDFRATLLAGADLTKTNLAGADLSGAMLAHATLRETTFDGATLEGTNLGAAVVEGVSFAAATLRKAVFARTKLRAVSLKDADLSEIDWLEAEIGAVDFEGALAPGIDFLPGTDLTRCRFPRARLKKANFLENKADGVDFAGADLELVTFLTVSANGADFRGASLRKFHAVVGCSFEGADFEGADLTGAFLRGANLRGARLEGARLEGADLSECDLTGATLSGAQARELLLVRANLSGANLRGANLMETMLQKATLHGTDLSSSNLFAANLGLVRLDTATKVAGANLKRALMLPRARRNT